MFELGGQFHFPHEPIDAHRGRQLGTQDLDGHLAIQFEIRREIDDGHATGTEFVLDGVAVRESGFQTVEDVGHGVFGPVAARLQYDYEVGVARHVAGSAEGLCP